MSTLQLAAHNLCCVRRGGRTALLRRARLLRASRWVQRGRVAGQRQMARYGAGTEATLAETNTRLCGFTATANAPRVLWTSQKDTPLRRVAEERARRTANAGQDGLGWPWQCLLTSKSEYCGSGVDESVVQPLLTWVSVTTLQRHIEAFPAPRLPSNVGRVEPTHGWARSAILTSRRSEAHRGDQSGRTVREGKPKK
jgi:hypothetical protein